METRRTEMPITTCIRPYGKNIVKKYGNDSRALALHIKTLRQCTNTSV